MRRNIRAFSAIFDAVLFLSLLMLASGVLYAHLADRGAVEPLDAAFALQQQARHALVTFLHLDPQVPGGLREVADLLLWWSSSGPGPLDPEAIQASLTPLLASLIGPGQVAQVTAPGMVIGTPPPGDRAAWSIALGPGVTTSILLGYR